MTDVIVGIDLGTSCYSVAIYSNNVVQPLRDLDNRIRTPCYVSCTIDNVSEVKVGFRAKFSGVESLVVYEPKRLIGREYGDYKVHVLLQWLSYYVNKKQDDLEIVIQRGQKKITTTPHVVYERILEYIKKCIEKTKKKVRTIQAVITVPPAFTREQRNATLAAAKSVGFQVLKLLNEPTAIAMSYFSKHEALKKGDYFLVYDLGASDFKIGIFKVIENSFEFVYASTDTGISGQDFDIVLYHYICNKLWELYQFDVGPNKDAIRQLLIKSEIAKKDLSVDTKTTIFVTNTPPHDNIVIEISRSEFEEVVKHLLEQTVNIVEQFINNSKIDKLLIKKIILYGGLSRVPKISQLLNKHFENIKSEELVFGDTDVAEGAALFAALFLVADP